MLCFEKKKSLIQFNQSNEQDSIGQKAATLEDSPFGRSLGGKNLHEAAPVSFECAVCIRVFGAASRPRMETKGGRGPDGGREYSRIRWTILDDLPWTAAFAVDDSAIRQRETG